jgi:hypothetical protein
MVFANRSVPRRPTRHRAAPAKLALQVSCEALDDAREPSRWSPAGRGTSAGRWRRRRRCRAPRLPDGSDGRATRMVEAWFEPVVPGDAPALVQLARQFHDEDGHPLSPRSEAALVRAVAGAEPLARVRVVRAETGGPPAGYLARLIHRTSGYRLADVA